MRSILCFLFVVSYFFTVGCSEFVRPVEQSAATEIDVVGEPTDAVSDSPRSSDILGSATSIPDGSESVANSLMAAPNSEFRVDEGAVPDEATGEPDVVGSSDVDRPNVLKTSRSDGHRPETMR